MEGQTVIMLREAVWGIVVTEDLWGTWQLERATERDPSDGTERQPPYGPDPIGLICFTPGGRMVSLVYDGRETIPPGEKRAHTSYCGAYQITGNRLVTIVDAAADPSRIGTQQVRAFEVRGDGLILTPPRREAGTQRELVWRKLATNKGTQTG
jgi:hypothetical protein